VANSEEEEKPSILAELGRIHEHLLRGDAIEESDLRVLTTAATGVGIKLPTRSRLRVPFVKRLKEQWMLGSRLTGSALISANEAANAGDVARAVAILHSAIADIANMPFYVRILETEVDDLTHK
jgi:hypothetical protein